MPGGSILLYWTPAYTAWSSRGPAPPAGRFFGHHELAGGIGFDAVYELRALLGGLEERDGRARLGLAGGGVGDGAIDGSEGRDAKEQSEREASFGRRQSFAALAAEFGALRELRAAGRADVLLLRLFGEAAEPARCCS